MPARRPRKADAWRNRLVVLGAVASVSALALGAWVAFSGGSVQARRRPVFVVDDKGLPRMVVIVGPDAYEVSTDNRGVAWVPAKWVGESVSVRCPKTLRELVRTKLVADHTGQLRIVVVA